MNPTYNKLTMLAWSVGRGRIALRLEVETTVRRRITTMREQVYWATG